MRDTGLIVLLVPALFGSLPTWPYSDSWGYIPCGLLAVAVVVATVVASQKGRS